MPSWPSASMTARPVIISLSRNDGTLEKGQLVDGKFGKAIQFSAGKKGNSNSATWNSLVDPKWTQDVPIYVRAMVLAGSNLFIAGPPDIIDEEETFQKLTENDEQVQQLLAQQDAVLGGKDGGLLLSVNTIPVKSKADSKWIRFQPGTDLPEQTVSCFSRRWTDR